MWASESWQEGYLLDFVVVEVSIKANNNSTNLHSANEHKEKQEIEVFINKKGGTFGSTKLGSKNLHSHHAPSGTQASTLFSFDHLPVNESRQTLNLIYTKVMTINNEDHGSLL